MPNPSITERFRTLHQNWKLASALGRVMRGAGEFVPPYSSDHNFGPAIAVNPAPAPEKVPEPELAEVVEIPPDVLFFKDPRSDGFEYGALVMTHDRPADPLSNVRIV